MRIIKLILIHHKQLNKANKNYKIVINKLNKNHNNMNL